MNIATAKVAIKDLKVGVVATPKSIAEILTQANTGVPKKYHQQIFVAVVQTQNLTLDVAADTLEQ